jgi:putative restriction endonuclease
MNSLTDIDWQVRLAAFSALSNLTRTYGGVLPWAVIDAGFQFEGQTFRFANQSKGIFRPAGMKDAALSVKTTVPRTGAPKYEDIATDDAFVYAFQSRGPEYHDNKLLCRAIELGTPLIYFYGIEPGIYRALWPVYAAETPAQTPTVRYSSMV